MAMLQLVFRDRLRNARGYWTGLVAAEGAGWAVAVLMASTLVCFYVDRWLVLTIPQRLGAWGLMLGLVAFTLVRLVAGPLLRKRTDESLAVDIERRYPGLGERLLTSVELARQQERGEISERGFSPAMVQAVLDDTERATVELDFNQAFSRQGLRRSLVTFGVFVVLLVGHLLLMRPAMGAFFSRMMLNNTPVWRDTRLRLAHLEQKALRGSNATILITQEGKKRDGGRLYFRFGKGKWARVALAAGPGGAFEHTFPSVTEDIQFYARAGDGRSDKGLLRVVDAPAIIGAKLTLNYPAYMARKPAQVSAPSGGIAAPVGTRVEARLQANKPLTAAQVELPGAKMTSWEVRGDTVSGAVNVTQDGAYTLHLRDTDGFQNPEPQSFPIRAIADRTPDVLLRQPGGDLEVVPDAQIPLTTTAQDDYGLNQVRLRFTVEGRKSATLSLGRGGQRETDLELDSLWSLASLKLQPGDLIQYRIEATDFDNLNGPHVGSTPTYQIRVIDRGEAERRYQQRREELLRQLRDLIKEQKAARGEVDAERAKARPDAQRIAASESRQRALANQTEDVARQLQSLNQSAATNRLANPQELRAQEQAKNSLDDLAARAMPQAANEIATAQPMAQSQPRAARQQLGKASGQQKDIQRQLEAIEKALRKGSQLRRMAERFDRLAQEQRDLQAASGKLLPQTLGRKMDELTPEQRQELGKLGERQESLRKATDQAIDDLEKQGGSLSDRQQARAAQQAAQELRQQGTTSRQSEASRNVERNALGQAMGQQRQSAQDLEKAAQKLRDASDPEDPQAMQRKIEQAMQQLAQLTQKQQGAQDKTRKNMTREQRRQLARLERKLQQEAEKLARELQKLQPRSPRSGQASQSLSQASKSLGQASQSLSKDETEQAQEQQRRAMESLRRAMQSLQQAQAEAQKQQDPFAELREKLKQLANQEKALHQATQRIARERQSKGKLPAQTAELKELAQKQGEVEIATRKLQSDLPTEIFKQFGERARQAMTRSRQGLSADDPSERPTQVAQARAITLLDRLAKSLSPDPRDNKRGEGGGGGGGGGGGW